MEKLGHYIVHPVAAKFPLIQGEEFELLVQDIKENGLRNPIVVDYEDLVLIDGRNRFLACQAAGVTPRFDRRPEVDELDNILYIVSLNLRRRELSTGERAMIGTDLEPDIAKAKKEREEKRKGKPAPWEDSDKSDKRDKSQVTSADRRQVSRSKSATEVAEMVGVSTRAIERAKAIKKEDPTLAEKVASGEISLNSAYEKIKNPAPIIIEVSDKIQEASELVKQRQENRTVVPTGVLIHLADLNDSLREIERQVSDTKKRWPQAWREDISEGLRQHMRRVDLLVSVIEGKDEIDIEDLLGGG